MKVLIINGSPHKHGDTAYMVSKFKEKFSEDTIFEELYLYDENIKPCMDCRYCNRNIGCVIKDKMDIIVNDDYDVIVMASPIYMYNMTPPVFSMITRLNYIWSNKFFLKKELKLKRKKGILILAGGGDGNPTHALDMAKLLFKYLNVDFDIEKDYIYSLKTGEVLAKEDSNVAKLVDIAYGNLNNIKEG